MSLKHDRPLSLYSLVFLDAVALYLASQDFELPVCRVFFVYPAVDSSPAWHLSPARRTGNLFWWPSCFQFLIDAVDLFLRMKHFSMTAGTLQKMFLLCCVRTAGWNITHVCTVSPYLLGHRAHIPSRQPCNLSATQAIHIISMLR